MYVHSAQIQGTGPFPVDMLRYDACWPCVTKDAERLAATFAQPTTTRWTVEVQQYTPLKQHNFSVKRWESFGCNCSVFNSHKF
jgi:hypothetical protein